MYCSTLSKKVNSLFLLIAGRSKNFNLKKLGCNKKKYYAKLSFLLRILYVQLILTSLDYHYDCIEIYYFTNVYCT